MHTPQLIDSSESDEGGESRPNRPTVFNNKRHSNHTVPEEESEHTRQSFAHGAARINT